MKAKRRGRLGRYTEGKEIDQRFVAMGYIEVEVATKKFQMPGKQEAPRKQQE